MAYIKNESKVGKTVILQNEHKSYAGTFEKGTEVKIIGQSQRGYDIEDEYGNRMIETGYDSIE